MISDNVDITTMRKPVNYLLMPHQKGNSRFSFQSDLSFQEEEAISTIEEFIRYYWDSDNYTEVIYIKSGLHSILTLVNDSTYQKAMSSIEEMNSFVDFQIGVHDQAVNMDW